MRPGGRVRGADGPTLTVIWWRAIPAQIVGRNGPRTSRVLLHRRFQVAIDRAAERAGLDRYDRYIEEWHRVTRGCGADVDTEVATEATRLEAAYPRERLAALVRGGGLDASPAEAGAVNEVPRTSTAVDGVVAGPELRVTRRAVPIGTEEPG